MSDQTFLFGKHKGELIVDVLKTDPSYIKWVLNTPDMSETLKKLIVKLQKPAKAPKPVKVPEFLDESD